MIGLAPVESQRSADVAPVHVSRSGLSLMITARAPLDMGVEDVLHELYAMLDAIFASRPQHLTHSTSIERDREA